ncbi:MAG: hypothetical protein ACI4JW_07910 [Oscillospiraceae bacterium]
MNNMFYFAKVANDNAERFKMEKAAAKSKESIKEKLQNYFYGVLSLIGFALLMGCFFIINLI